MARREGAAGILQHPMRNSFRPTPGVDGLCGINTARRLYVVPAGAGVSCLGFDYADTRAKAVAEWLGRPDLAPPRRKGTARHFRAYKAAMSAGQAHHAATGERCNVELTPALVGLERRRVEVTERDGTRRRFWVGKSTGWMPCHLEIATRASSGGVAVYLPPGASVRAVDQRRR
jgi:hypothetical protein